MILKGHMLGTQVEIRNDSVMRPRSDCSDAQYKHFVHVNVEMLM